MSIPQGKERFGYRRLPQWMLINIGKKLCKKRSIYEWACYCNSNHLNLKTGYKDERNYPMSSAPYMFYKCNYYQYFGLREPK